MEIKIRIVEEDGYRTGPIVAMDKIGHFLGHGFEIIVQICQKSGIHEMQRIFDESVWLVFRQIVRLEWGSKRIPTSKMFRKPHAGVRFQSGIFDLVVVVR